MILSDCLSNQICSTVLKRGALYIISSKHLLRLFPVLLRNVYTNVQFWRSQATACAFHWQKQHTTTNTSISVLMTAGAAGEICLLHRVIGNQKAAFSYLGNVLVHRLNVQWAIFTQSGGLLFQFKVI